MERDDLRGASRPLNYANTSVSPYDHERKGLCLWLRLSGIASTSRWMLEEIENYLHDMDMPCITLNA